MSKKNIRRVFIANRGEIVRRIAETAKKIGVETVCLAEGNPPAYLLGLVDEFIPVKEENVSLYLDAKSLLAFAKDSGCDSVHPGFGFLAENTEFASLVEKSGLVWLGPKSDVIKLMADKSAAREIAEKSYVPCLRGLNHFVYKDKNHTSILDDFCEKASFPLLIKAAFGGGGKGMRVSEDKEALLANLETASREAMSSFGNDTLVIEEYVPESRHVEVQVVGDEFGQIKILGDRDCSVQRRHQKIIEEAPAPFLSDSLRKALHKAAYNLAKGISYTSCGTVEFLVPWSMEKNTSFEDKFYFLEMNTRLQVEHPVTEEIFGLDIVELQFEIASGKKMGKEILDKSSQGHSVEARIYMEDPKRNFLPIPDFVAGFLPYQQNGIRWEIGIDQAEKVTGKFDPMIAKVVGTGRTREEACSLLRLALEKTFLGAESHNLSLLWEIFSDELFLNSSVSTSYLKHNLPRLLESISRREEKSKLYLDDIAEELIQTAHEKMEGSDLNSRFDVRKVTDLSFGLSPFLKPTIEQNPLKNQLVRQSVFVNLNGEKEKVFYYSFLNTLIKKEASVVHLSLVKKPNGEKKYILSYNGFVLQKVSQEKKWKGETSLSHTSTQDILC